MSDYDWQNIFKSKTEKELLTIYVGDSNLNFEAEIYAGLELKSRKFNFKTIEQIHNRKIEELKIDMQEYENLNYENSKFRKNKIYGGIGFVVLLILFVMNYETWRNQDDFKFYKAILYISIALITFLTAKWSFERHKKKRKKTIEERIELLKKLISTDN